MGELNFQNVFDKVRKDSVMVHCITNYVTINDVANIILAMGASPIMADDPIEVCEITGISDCLVINMGTLKQNIVRSMLLAGKKANESGHPIVFDPVGVGASKFRKDTAIKLLNEVHFSVIRGNISEIKTLYEWSENSYGVDAKKDDIITEDNQKKVIRMAKELAVKTKAVIVITGETDLVTDGVIAGFIGANQGNILEATVTAVSAMGICGEYARENAKGTGTLKVHLIDAMSNIDETWMERSNQIESRS